MRAADRAKELKEKFVGLGAPPARDEIKGALSGALARGRPGRKRKAEKMAQLNCACRRSSNTACASSRRATGARCPTS